CSEPSACKIGGLSQVATPNQDRHNNVSMTVRLQGVRKGAVGAGGPDRRSELRTGLLWRGRLEERLPDRCRVVNQRLVVSIKHLVAHRRGERLGLALAASP